MSPVHQTLGRDTGQQPGQFRDFGNIRLAIKNRLVRIQPQGHPGGGNFEGGLVDNLRVTTLDQRVIISQKITGPNPVFVTGLDGQLDGSNIVSQVGGAGGRDAGQNRMFTHDG